MIPHNIRNYRVILDLLFNLSVDVIKFPSVNDSTTPAAPQHDMDELSRVLKRLAALISATPDDFPPFLFSKLDIKDVF